eukprot:scaffold14447_cov82-Cylindrotheca_fusiformis.AAC.1
MGSHYSLLYQLQTSVSLRPARVQGNLWTLKTFCESALFRAVGIPLTSPFQCSATKLRLLVALLRGHRVLMVARSLVAEDGLFCFAKTTKGFL